MRDFAETAIDALIEDLPDYRPGTRPIHAPGISLTGWFEANPVARRYTDAEHFSGAPVPVIVRFSSGTGLAGAPDSSDTVRGMAVRFCLGDEVIDEHGVRRGTVETDMIAMTLPVFFVKTTDRFLELVHAARDLPVPPVPWWRKARAAVRLETPLRAPRPNEAEMIAFADRYRPARAATVASAPPCLPESYATLAYHAVHAFTLVAGPTRTWGRFHWEPVAGVRAATGPLGKEYLRQEMPVRLARGPVQFVLRMTVAELGDDTSDSTTPWPSRRIRVTMGDLWLDALAPDQIHGGELLGFDPTRLVPGVELSDDEILQARGDVYSRSFERRRAAASSLFV